MREGDEHSGQLLVHPPGQVRDNGDWDAHEDALEHGLAPGRVVEVSGRIRPDSRADQSGVVGTEGIPHDRQGSRTDVQQRQGQQHGATLGGVPLFIEPGRFGGEGFVGHRQGGE